MLSFPPGIKRGIVPIYIIHRVKKKVFLYFLMARPLPPPPLLALPLEKEFFKGSLKCYLKQKYWSKRKLPDNLRLA